MVTALIASLTPPDVTVLGEAVTLVLDTPARFVHGAWLHDRCAAKGLDDDSVVASATALAGVGYVEAAPLLAGRIDYVILAWEGVLTWLRATRPDLGDFRRRLLAHLLDAAEHRFSIGLLATELRVERLVVEALLVAYDQRDDVRIVRFAGGLTEVRDVSPSLRRELE